MFCSNKVYAYQQLNIRNVGRELFVLGHPPKSTKQKSNKGLGKLPSKASYTRLARNKKLTVYMKPSSCVSVSHDVKIGPKETTETEKRNGI